jgi:hypothetical protein
MSGTSDSPSLPVVMPRISKMEIAGRKRMKRKKSVKKRPRVPMNVAQSYFVPW